MFTDINLINKKLYLAPFSDLTIQLANKLKSEGVQISGYIDSYQAGHGIFKIHEIINHDYILICSPNHQKEIQKNFKNHNTILVYYYKNKFFFSLTFYYITFLKNLITFSSYRLSDKQKIKQLRNKHINENAYIICDGNGITNNLSKLAGKGVLFMSNNICYTGHRINFKSIYYTAIDEAFIYKNKEKQKKTSNIIMLYPDFLFASIKIKTKKTIYFRSLNTPNSDFDLEQGIYLGSNEVYAMISYSIYMGIKNIFLINPESNLFLDEKLRNRFIELNKSAKMHCVNIFNTSLNSNINIFIKKELQ